MILLDFYKNVKENPGKKAVVCDMDSLTYLELDHYSDLVASELIKLGVKFETPIGFWDESSVWVLVAILGIWKAQGVYVPISMRNPEQRVKKMLRESGVKIILTTSRNIDSSIAHTIYIEDCVSKNTAFEKMHHDNNPDALAYILFTSGSTGIPKGVMIEHKSMYNHLLAKKKLIGADQKSRIAQDAGIGFVISIWQLLLPLMTGATVYIITDNNKIHLKRYIRCLQEYRIQILEVVPTYLSLLLKYIKDKGIIFDELQYLIVTGEKFNIKLARECMMCFHEVSIINAYGPTEASDDVSHYTLQRGIEYDAIPIGEVIDHMRIDILDDELHTVPNGTKGNIVITGVGIARGYINQNDVGMNNFQMGLVLENERSYITGDYGYINQNNDLIYCGRKDNLIKLNGFRVDLSEIEHALLEIPGVINAVIIVEENSINTLSELYAYIELSEKQKGLGKSIRDALAEKLPYYMIPSRFILCDAFPMGVNGKTDKVGLVKKYLGNSNYL